LSVAVTQVGTIRTATTLPFRMLVTLEGTLRTLCPGYPVIQAAQDFAAADPRADGGSAVTLGTSLLVEHPDDGRAI
jgi:hypothetical protein